ncbi:MAG: RDD family protein [Longimicrobiales bacterium]
MSTHGAPVDPRGIITPDAFEVSDALLGRPLARPGRRLVALLIDLVVIGFITVVTKSFALVLGVVAAGFFIRASFKRTEVRGSVFGRAMRLSLGCLGVFIGIITAIIWAAVGFSGSSDSRVPDVALDGIVESAGGEGRSAAVLDLGGVLGGMSDFNQLRGAETPEDAEDAATELGRLLLDNGVPLADVESILAEAVPAARPWSDDTPDIVARALDRARGADGAAPTSAPDPANPDATADMTVAEAMAEYAELARSADASDAALARMAALRVRLRSEVAGDTLAALEERVDDLEELAQSRQRALTRAREDLAEAEDGGGIFAWLRQFVDELGFGFGWASLYLTVVLSWSNGLTVGKKFMGIRVVRLDGEPITWWVAFERAGGYAAGFATGLLGFAQVFWDANRQAIHDRIVGTVVVVDGAEPMGNWEEAL